MKFNLNLQIALYGLLILLIGLLFHAIDSARYVLAVVSLTGVGASILATGLTSWLITRHLAGIDVTAIVQALADISGFVRSDHSLELVFSLNKDGSVRITGEHAFTLMNHRGRWARKKFAIYTDLGSWNKRGGFESVVEPGGNVLQHEALAACMSEINGKTYFIKSYNINPRSSASFRFNTYGNYRRVDRLIWTVQDLSTDFYVRIVNNTGIKGAILIKVNHHRELEILERLTTLSKKSDGQEVIIIDFNCDVLPYQGFEVMWNLDEVLEHEAPEQIGTEPMQEKMGSRAED
jgi:hypothetical protein